MRCFYPLFLCGNSELSRLGVDLHTQLMKWANSDGTLAPRISWNISVTVVFNSPFSLLTGQIYLSSNPLSNTRTWSQPASTTLRKLWIASTTQLTRIIACLSDCFSPLRLLRMNIDLLPPTSSLFYVTENLNCIDSHGSIAMAGGDAKTVIISKNAGRLPC